MKRTFASICVAALALMGAAEAASPTLETWTESGGLFSIDRPAGWPVEAMTRGSGDVKDWVTGTADEECWVTAIPRPETASASAAQIVSAFSTPTSADIWVSAARAQRMFHDATPSVVSSAVDTTKPFPFQTARIAHPKKGETLAAIHVRPGLEVHVFCVAYDEADHSELFTAIAGSVATPKDAALIATLPAAATSPPAPAAAAGQ